MSDGDKSEFTGNVIGGVLGGGGAGLLKGRLPSNGATPPTPSGLARRLQFGGNWASASLDKAISRHLGGKFTSWQTATRKIIYENPSTGRQIVRDLDGGYFRIFQPKKFGSMKGQYLDMLGRVAPNTDKGQMLSHFIIE